MCLELPAGIDRNTFLRDYWQRRPLLMPAALPTADLTLSPEGLAGLACEPEFESRLLIEQAPQRWEVRHGPFDDAAFAALPERRWTLLVQDVDKFLPEVARLLDLFDFVPAWRVDDVMVSYAVDQGSVGPHSDAYDVFLLQVEGRRRWRISRHRYDDSDLIPGIEQRILARFDTDQEWVLEPGDVLYLPPGVPHWGIAEGDCMTYSVGFRAPSQQELAADWFQYLVSLCDERRLADPRDLRSDRLAELTEGLFTAAADLLDGLPGRRSDAFRRWLGRHLTEPKPQFQLLPREQTWASDDLASAIDRGLALQRHPFARLAWAVLESGQVALFFQGEEICLPAELQAAVRRVADRRRLSAAAVAALTAGAPEVQALLRRLINEGVLEPVE